MFLGKLDHYLETDSSASYLNTYKDGFFQTIRSWKLLVDEAVRREFCTRTLTGSDPVHFSIGN